MAEPALVVRMPEVMHETLRRLACEPHRPVAELMQEALTRYQGMQAGFESAKAIGSGLCRHGRGRVGD